MDSVGVAIELDICVVSPTEQVEHQFPWFSGESHRPASSPDPNDLAGWPGQSQVHVPEATGQQKSSFPLAGPDQVIQMGQLLSGCPIASGPSDVFVMHEVLDKIHGSISGSKEDRGATSNCCH